MVVTSQDETGRARSVLFMKKPSKRDYPDYYEIIEKPIGFLNIRAKIEKGAYSKNFDLFREDMMLIFSNAQTYNVPDSMVYDDSLMMQVFLFLFLFLFLFFLFSFFLYFNFSVFATENL